MTIDVSMLVCTRDRAASLARTLASITRAADRAADIRIELIVVDNGSSDDTRDRIAAWWRGQSFPVELLHEPRSGLSRARNRGLAAVRGRIVAMTDDDCVLHPDYLVALAGRFAQVRAPAIVGGRILLGDPRDQPVTIKLEDHPMIAAPDAFPGGFVMGANLAFTRDVIARVGPFDERFGSGARFVSAEDTDFLFRAIGRGIPVEYDPYFVVDHHHGRRRQEEVAALLAGYAYGDGALYAKHLLTDRRIVRAIARDLADLWRGRRAEVRPFPFIRAFSLFRLRQKARGFFAYCWWRVRSGMALHGRALPRSPDRMARLPSELS